MIKFLASVLLLASLGLSAQNYSPALSPLTTEWGQKVTPENAWQQYPRPQMQRNEWQHLNGLWNYSIQKKGTTKPANYEGKILVPFGIESSLSGVGKPLLPEQELWYNRNFSIPESWGDKEVILHFDAVDWETKVWINGIPLSNPILFKKAVTFIFAA